MKQCVITGAADGIGKALAQQFATAGYAITGIDNDRTQSAHTCAELKERGATMAWISADLAEEAQIRQALAVLSAGPPVDVFVHNAGINAVGRFADSDIVQQQAVIDVNLLAPMLLTQGLLERGILTAKGSLVFIASLSHFVSYPGAAVYAAGKDGLASYARSMTVALDRRGTHVLTVYPGPTRTAHAQRYSPDNRREQQRMPPEKLAKLIYRAVQGRRRVLIPGRSNQVFAVLGRAMPGMTERMLREAILDRLER